MSNDKMREILDAPDKLVSRTTNPLARLMRVILYETDIDASTFYRLLDMYVKSENSELAKTEKSSFKTNLVAALTAPKLQILGFERFLKLLNPKSVRFSVTLTWRNGGRQTYDVDLDVIGSMDDDLKGNSWDEPDDLGGSDEYLDDDDRKGIVDKVRGNIDYYLTEILKPTGNPFIDKKVKKIVDASSFVSNSQSPVDENESDGVIYPPKP